MFLDLGSVFARVTIPREMRPEEGNLLPYQRTAEVLNELAGLGISPGTLQRQPNDSFNSLVLTVQSQPPMPPLE